MVGAADSMVLMSSLASQQFSKAAVSMDTSTPTSKGDEDTATLLCSRDSAVDINYTAVKVNRFDFSSVALRQACFALHSILVGIHLVLLGIWVKHLEHRAVFPLAHQSVVSFCISATTTSFATTYCALMVWLMQSLAMRHSLETRATLTSIHDTTSAWGGFGSAVLSLWSQRMVSASISEVLRAVLYLGNIMLLHVTAPALLSLQTFNSTTLLPVVTQGLPNYNFQDGSMTFYELWRSIPFVDNATSFSQQILGLLPFLGNLTTLGLEGGTLYDVLPVNAGTGEVAVNATALNITCGYVAGTHNSTQGNSSTHWVWQVDVDVPDRKSFYIQDTQPGIVVNLCSWNYWQPWCNPDSIWLYSTIPIVDSHGHQGPSVHLNPPLNTSVSEIQLLRCVQSLVPQLAQVDSQSRSVGMLPAAEKGSSRWFPAPTPPDLDLSSYESRFALLQSYGIWHQAAPASDIPLVLVPENWEDTYVPEDLEDTYISIADEYVVQRFNLLGDSPPPHLLLHEVENTLASLTSAIFWLLGHIPLVHKSLLNLNGTVDKWRVENPFFLNEGRATIMEVSVKTRLNLNIIAILTGLFSAIMLTALTLPFSRTFSHSAAGCEGRIHGTGFLQAIWLYRDDPELKLSLPQVDDPTEDNLRAAGMVRSQFGNHRQRKRSISD
ncbi:hypothetical protein C8R43DRAFT_121053 [Mycena crocata]|nr:hypothetical protein C8R43DRAFT_121053 [Mycena crocata]